MNLEARQINTIRALAIDAVKAANSGHTGTAMALAPLAHVLFTRTLRYDSANPDWPDRDRFVLSAGHASMLLYAMLHLVGTQAAGTQTASTQTAGTHAAGQISLDDIRQFRQLGSNTPGHPERGVTPGVEVTTGPLGQGLANAVGMAIAERNLRDRLGADLIDHHTYVIVSDGDLMEGISHEAASLAGHQQLGRLIAIYDDNRITIDGDTSLTLSDDAAARFAAYGWHTEELGAASDGTTSDGAAPEDAASEDTGAIASAIERARLVTDRPSLIVMRSHIGYPFPNAIDTAAAHGAITDDDEIAAAKVAMGMDPAATFQIADDVAQAYRLAGQAGAAEHSAWQQRLADSGHDQQWLDALLSATASTAAGAAATDTAGGTAAASATTSWQSQLPTFEAGTQVATRTASNRTLDALLDAVPALIVGGADLTGNTGTNIAAEQLTAANPGGRKLYYGVREHAMGAIANGMAAHGGVLPVVGTFLVFSDYMRPAVRIAALSNLNVVFVWSHDSIGVGEDGPTHQPIEHLAALRAIPNLVVIRPADANETVQAWQVIIDRASGGGANATGGGGPTALILTRQNVPVLAGTDRTGPDRTSPDNANASPPNQPTNQVARGAYVLIDAPDPAIILAGSGSEVHCCVDAAATLAAEGIASRVVSMPSWELFEAQPPEYRHSVLGTPTAGTPTQDAAAQGATTPDTPTPPATVPVLGVEAGSSLGWHRYANDTVTIDRFGASAPGATLMKTFGFTADAVAAAARKLLT